MTSGAPYRVHRVWLRDWGWHALVARVRRRWRNRAESDRGPDLSDMVPDLGDDIVSLVVAVVVVPLVVVALLFFLLPVLLPVVVTLLDLLLVVALAVVALPLVALSKTLLRKPWLLRVYNRHDVVVREIEVFGWRRSSLARAALRLELSVGEDPATLQV